MKFSDYFVVELYRNAGTAVEGPASGANWLWPGIACTSSTLKLYPAFQCKQIVFARWVLVWNPSAPGESPTGVRLVYCDDGPSNIVEIVRQTRTFATTPFDDAVDITTKLGSIWCAYAGIGMPFQIGHQAFGNGANGPLIYGSWIEVGLS